MENDDTKVVAAKTFQTLPGNQSLLQITLPARILIIGDSGVGKTTLILKLLEKRDFYFRGTFSKIIYAIPGIPFSFFLFLPFHKFLSYFTVNSSHILAPTIDRIREICPAAEVIEGLPKISQMMSHGHSLVILGKVPFNFLIFTFDFTP